MSAAMDFIRALRMSGTARGGARFQRFVMRQLVETLLAHVGIERPAFVECAASPVIETLFCLGGMQLRFTIGNWAMVRVVRVTAQRQVLQIDELELDEEDGLETYGLAGSVENKAIIGVTASVHRDPLLVRVGGFTRAAVSRCGRGPLVAVLTSPTNVLRSQEE